MKTPMISGDDRVVEEVTRTLPDGQTTTVPETCVTSVDEEVEAEVRAAIPERFVIESETGANWLVKKVIAAREYSERVKQWADQEVRRAAREEQTLMYIFGRQIETWVRAEIQSRFKGRRSSLPLPAGVVGFRKVGEKLVVDDEAVVIRWAKATCPAAVVVVEKIAKKILNEYVETTGDVPAEGIHVEPPVARFYIK